MKKILIWFKKTFVVLFWLCVWQILYLLIDNKILLAGPLETLKVFFRQAVTLKFWQTVLFSFSRIGLGFFLAFFAGLFTASVSCKWNWFDEFLSPVIQFMKSIPVASFVILALIWTGAKNLSVFISFLVVYPILYISTLTGLKNTDQKLLEMAQVFGIPFHKKIFFLYRPALYPHLYSACKSALGMGLKSGIAAEVIGVPSGSVGEGLYSSKIYLDTAGLFSWTLTIILLSTIFEKLVLFILKKCSGKGAISHDKTKQ
ncbi:MAG: ABC transporter permease subunit [Lachnospiraceae bacterium]|nr:ABC transporter permease subunit [Lachnospiraceae bacterium]